MTLDFVGGSPGETASDRHRYINQLDYVNMRSLERLRDAYAPWENYEPPPWYVRHEQGGTPGSFMFLDQGGTICSSTSASEPLVSRPTPSPI